MQRLLSALGKLLQKSLLLFSLILSFSLAVGFALPTQPSFADVLKPASMQEEPMSIKVESREQAYEEVAEAARTPEGLDKEYKENLDAYREDHPGPGLIEKAQQVVEKVTGQE